MDVSVGWFVGLAGLAVGALAFGAWAARHGGWSTRIAMAGGLVLLGVWVYLIHHPAVAVRVIPVNVLSYIEGTAAVPLFMIVVGVAWGRSQLPRQRRLVFWAAVIGAVYFCNGGMWMLQTTPQIGFAETVERDPVMQSQEYSCVPAACATALNQLGVYTSEAEMARLTHTRPATGATIIRAMDGLSRRLASSPYQVDMLQPDYEDLVALPMPVITPLQFEATRRHMVTLLRVTPESVLIADPVEGQMVLGREMFEKHYIRQAIVFRPRS